MRNSLTMSNSKTLISNIYSSDSEKAFNLVAQENVYYNEKSQNHFSYLSINSGSSISQTKKKKMKSRPKQQQQKVNEKTVAIKSTQVSRKNPRTIYV